MSSFLDFESLQQLLANAYAVQQSQMDSRSLSAIVELQRLIAGGDMDVDGSLHLIAHYTQDVAGATGVAIGLLKGNQLVYRAGCGSAATYVGRSMPASLVVPAKGKANSEILRVENTETDARIESAICRQFGSKSLLILLISSDQGAAGVLEIFFGEAHAFADSELRTYRLLASLIGEALSLAARHKQNKAETADALITSLLGSQRILSENHSDQGYGQGTFQHGLAAMAVAMESIASYAGKVSRTAMRLAARVPGHERRRSLSVAAIALLMLAGLLAFSHRRPASAVASSSVPTATTQQSVLLPAKASPANAISNPDDSAPRHRTAAARRVRVSEQEVDYIRDDVTVRYFNPQPAHREVRTGNNEVAYIGDDVTVRYFVRKPSPNSPIAGSAGLNK